MGILLSSNFTLNAGLPLDSRSIVSNTAARDVIPAIQRYDGMEVYVLDVKEKHQLQGGVTNGDWVITGAGASVAQENFAPIGFTNHAIVANDGNNVMSINGDHTGNITDGGVVVVANSTDIDGEWEVVSTFFNGSETEITVDGVFDGPTADGDVNIGHVNDLTMAVVDLNNDCNINIFKDGVKIDPFIKKIGATQIRVVFSSPLGGVLSAVVQGVS